MVLLPSPSERRRHLVKRWGVARTGQVAPQGTVDQYEHWDGSVDVVVRPAAFRIRIRPDRQDTPALIAALETAVRAHEQATRTGTKAEQRAAAAAVEAVKRQLGA